MIMLCAFAMVIAVAASPALAEERVSGAAPTVKSGARAESGWGISGAHSIAPTRLASARGLSFKDGSPTLLTPAYGGGTNISSAVELPSAGASGTVNAVTHTDDVYWFYLEAGATIDFTLNAAAGSNTELWLFPPTAVDVGTSSSIWASDAHVFPTDPEYDWYTAPVSGIYYIDVYSGVTGSSAYTLDFNLYNYSANDMFPGAAPSASPINGWVHSVWDQTDAYRFPLKVGDRLNVRLAGLSGASSDFDLDLAVYNPTATLVGLSAQDGPAAEALSIVATQTGNHAVRTIAYSGYGWGSLTWSVNPVRPAFTRSPSASKLTYKRKKGKAKFTLKAKVLNQFGLPLKSTKVYLQTSSNGRSWKNSYTMYTNSTGWLTKTITAKKKGTKYYRWYRPKTTTNASAQTGAQRVVIK